MIKFFRLCCLVSIYFLNAPDFLGAQQSDVKNKKLEERTRIGVIKYLNRLIKDSLIVTGQHCGGEDFDQTKAYQTFFENLHSVSGRYPGLLGFDYGGTTKVDFDYVNNKMIEHWNKGGLVCVSWQADNPFKAGYQGSNWNSIQHRDSIDLKKLLSSAPFSAEKDSYQKELMVMARQLKVLKDAGVVVLWRPFHEMNGTWFWWGVNHAKQPTNIGDFHLLWQDMVNVFKKQGLTNIVWVYSPNNPFNSSSKEAVLAMFPGRKYVDLVGLDIYKAPVPDFTENYELLKKLNKTIVIGECGDDIDNKGERKVDEIDLLEKYRGRAAYFMHWHSWYKRSLNVKINRAIIDNDNVKEMMNHPAAVTLEDMK